MLDSIAETWSAEKGMENKKAIMSSAGIKNYSAEDLKAAARVCRARQDRPRL